METRLLANSSLDLFVLPLMSVSISRRPSFLQITGAEVGYDLAKIACLRADSTSVRLFVSTEGERRIDFIETRYQPLDRVASSRRWRRKIDARNDDHAASVDTGHDVSRKAPDFAAPRDGGGRQVVRFDVFSSQLESMYTHHVQVGVGNVSSLSRKKERKKERSPDNSTNARTGTAKERKSEKRRLVARDQVSTIDWRSRFDLRVSRFDRWQRAVSDPVTMTPRKWKLRWSPADDRSITRPDSGPMMVEIVAWRFVFPAGEWGVGSVEGGISAPTPRPDLPPSRSHLDPLLPAASIIHRRARSFLRSDSNFFLHSIFFDRSRCAREMERRFSLKIWWCDGIQFQVGSTDLLLYITYLFVLYLLRIARHRTPTFPLRLKREKKRSKKFYDLRDIVNVIVRALSYVFSPIANCLYLL